MLGVENFFSDLAILIVFAALLSYLAIIFKQPVIIAYILCGILAGPHGFGLIKEIEFLNSASRIGVTFLLFLAGITLHPRHLARLFTRTSLVTAASCFTSFIIGFCFAATIGFNLINSLYIGFALMFSSTIMVIKLLPTTKLHHGKIGALCIGLLILEDLIAIAILILMRGFKSGEPAIEELGTLILKSVIFVAILFLLEQFVIRKIMLQVDRFEESIFIIGIAWCLGLAVVAQKIGLSFEIGAFFAGVALARHPISLFISEKLKPLRDFFLVIFFFVLGAQINFFQLNSVLLPAIILAIVFTTVKPIYLFQYLRMAKIEPDLASEASVRMGLLSEFSLLIAITAFSLGNITQKSAQFIGLVTILTMIISSYRVVLTLPTPIGTKERLIRD